MIQRFLANHTILTINHVDKVYSVEFYLEAPSNIELVKIEESDAGGMIAQAIEAGYKEA